jgi:outer membrane protein assembly factor BamB
MILTDSRTTTACVLAGLSLAAASGHGIAGDWPQILGPERTGIAAGEQLADAWPEAGPPILWTRSVGEGTAGVAIQGDAVVLFHRPSDEEVVEVLDGTTGESRWRKSYATTFASQIGGDDGPLCVPTIDEDRVVTFGPQGVLSCWNLSNGKLLWRRETHQDFGALEGYFGAGSSPLVVNDGVIVNVGGAKESAGIVAFDRQTGDNLWQASKERASYAAPTVATFAGRSVVLCLARLGCLGLDPTTGEVLFEVPFGKRGPTVNAATPVVLGDSFFLTASYGIGAALVNIEGNSASEIWRKPDVLSSQYTTPIAHEGLLYGIDGRDDLPPAHLRCIDPRTGEVLWSEDNFGYATLVGAGDKLLLVKTDGELVLARANRERFESLGRHQLTSDTLRALPALSEGRLLVRDTTTLYCVAVGRH